LSLLALASGLVTFIPFVGVPGTDWWGLGIGGASLIYFSWSMLLASRIEFVHMLFGGFDRTYIWHRLFSLLAVLTMWLHIQAENDVSNAIMPFGEDMAELGYELAESAETAVIVLTVISVFKILPYAIWKLSHKLFIVPFLLGAFHFITSENTFELFSAWSNYFLVFVSVGTLAFLHRLIAIDLGLSYRAYKVTQIENFEDYLAVSVRPNRKLRRETPMPGQFIFLSFPESSKEQHPFSISEFDEDKITVRIAKTGDWTEKLAKRISVGSRAMASKPTGELKLDSPRAESRVWFAAGSGAAPYLSSKSFIRDAQPTKFVYSYRGEESAMALAKLRSLAIESDNFELVEINTALRPRLTDEEIRDFTTSQSHVVACGPEALIDSVRRNSRGKTFDFEMFDYRLSYDPRPWVKTGLQKAREVIGSRF
jgi:predicted ferric reductase